MSRYVVIALILLVATAILSGFQNQLLFVGTFPGWLGFGLVSVGALGLAAFRSSVSALPAAVLACAVMLSPLALPYSFGVLLFAASFVIASALKQAPGAGRVGALTAVVAAIWAAYAIACWVVLQVVPSAGSFAETNRLAGEKWMPLFELSRMVVPLGHANHTSGVGVLLLPVFAMFAWKASGLRRAGWLAATALAFLLIYAGGSRAALLAPAVAVAGYILFIPGARISVRRKVALFSSGFVLLALLVAVHAPFREWIFNHETKTASDLVRRDYAEGCLAMIRERPLIGFGAGSLPTKFPAFSPDHAEQFSCYHAHSTPFQWAAEFGVPGLALFAIILVASSIALVRRARRDDQVCDVRTGVCLAATAYAVFCLFDYQANIPALGVVWGVILGVALSSDGAEYSHGKPRRVAVIGSRVMFGFAALAVAYTLVSEAGFRRDVMLASRESSPETAMNLLLRAADAAPDNAGVQGLAAAALEDAGRRSGDGRFMALADREWANASKLAPYVYEFPLRRALALTTSDPRAAIALYKDALHLHPKSSFAWNGLALAYLKTGDISSSEAALSLGLCVRPRDWFSPFMRKLPGISPSSLKGRFDLLRRAYATENPDDRFALRELDAAASLIGRADSVNQDMREFVAKRTGPVAGFRTKLFAAMSRGDAAGPRALIAATYATESAEITPAQAQLLFDQYRGLAEKAYAGVRTVAEPEETLWYGAYLGVADMKLPTPYVTYEDLLAQLFIYDTAPALRVSRKFLLTRLDALP